MNCPHCGAVDPAVRFILGFDVCPATGYRDDDAVMCLECGRLSDPADWDDTPERMEPRGEVTPKERVA